MNIRSKIEAIFEQLKGSSIDDQDQIILQTVEKLKEQRRQDLLLAQKQAEEARLKVTELKSSLAGPKRRRRKMPPEPINPGIIKAPPKI